MASSAYHAPAATACSQQEPARQFTIPSDAAVHQEQQPPSMAAYQAFIAAREGYVIVVPP